MLHIKTEFQKKNKRKKKWTSQSYPELCSSGISNIEKNVFSYQQKVWQNRTSKEPELKRKTLEPTYPDIFLKNTLCSHFLTNLSVNFLAVNYAV